MRCWHVLINNVTAAQSYLFYFRLVQEFLRTKARFRESNINAEELYMFHGTKENNINLILEENFRLDKAVGQVYGAGIYFSEFPSVSCSYGTLILCRVLPGNIEVQVFNFGSIYILTFLLS